MLASLKCCLSPLCAFINCSSMKYDQFDEDHMNMLFEMLLFKCILSLLMGCMFRKLYMNLVCVLEKR